MPKERKKIRRSRPRYFESAADRELRSEVRRFERAKARARRKAARQSQEGETKQ